MTTGAGDNGWMLEKITNVRGVRHSVVLTSDGFVTVRCARTETEVAERLAAACAGLASLGKGIGGEFGDGTIPRQVMIEFGGGFLFVRGAGDGSYLAVVTEAVIDPALVAQQMQAQVLAIGEHTLSAKIRRQ
jgi:predicted regulator of Ras-like GTPase activity (Roadblock/LC7/MglB family)